MNLFERALNLWKLSDYQPAKNTGDLIVNEEPTAILAKKSQKITKVFLPRVTVTPAEEIINEPQP